MYYLTRPSYTAPRGCLGDVLNFHTLALKNLMPCLIHAYIGASASLCLSSVSAVPSCEVHRAER